MPSTARALASSSSSAGSSLTIRTSFKREPSRTTDVFGHYNFDIQVRSRSEGVHLVRADDFRQRESLAGSGGNGLLGR